MHIAASPLFYTPSMLPIRVHQLHPNCQPIVVPIPQGSGVHGAAAGIPGRHLVCNKIIFR